MNFSALYNSLYRYFNPHWDFRQAESLTAFRAYLNDRAKNPVIRMWVDFAPGSGHQASTIGILRQLAAPVDPAKGFGYAGTIEVYYHPGDRRDPTLPKLHRLLPEVHGGTQGTVDSAEVKLIEWREGLQPAPVNLGFTGGADDIDERGHIRSPNFAARVGARYFLRLQPYLWGAPDQIQFSDTTRPFVTLTKQRVLGYDSFRQRAYYIRTPVPEPDWRLYAGGAYSAQAAVVRALTPADAQWGVCPVYSIRSSGNMELSKPAYERMFEVLTAVLASQRTPDGGSAPNARSIVVLSCDVFGTDSDKTGLVGLIRGGLTESEQIYKGLLELDRGGPLGDRPLTDREKAQYRNYLKGQRFRAAWLESIKATDRIRLVWGDSLDVVKRVLPWLTGGTDRVLFVHLGKIPEPLFTWSMQASKWPPVFEGQSTATVALNIGNPYFHVARPASYGIQYPTTIIGYEAWETVHVNEPGVPVVVLPRLPRKVQDAANQLTLPVAEWSPVAAENPPAKAGALVRTYNAEPADGPLHEYFASVRAFYRIANNDKLRVGAGFMQYILHAAQQAELRDLAAPSVLETLLAALQDNTVDGTLRVAPGALSRGGIHDLYTGFLGADPGLVLTGSTITPEYTDGTLTAIVTTGATSFLGVPLSAKIRFTAPEGVVIANGRYTHDQRWALDEIPWIGFSSPFVELCVIDSGAAPAGSVGGTLEGVDVELAFQLPVVEGKWQLAGAFAPPYPGIARFYQLAGGVDLVRELPAPFDGLAGFGLQNANLVYDTKAGQVETIGFRFGTSAGFKLVGDVQVENVSVDVVVQEPADLKERRVDWTVRGTFTLGTGDDAGTIMLGATGPELVLTGSLVSGVLRISDIINAFAPGVALRPPSEPAVTEFQSSFTPGTGDYSVSCALNIDWPVVVAGRQIFSIDGIQFGASRFSRMVTGSLNGYVTVGSGESAVPLELTASYATGAGWTFAVVQAPDSVVSLSALANQFLPPSWHIEQDYGITGLGLTVAVDKGSWVFTGRTAEPWEVPFISGLKASASLTLGYNAGTAASLAALPGMSGSTVPLDQAAGGCEGTGWFTRLETEWTWQDIDVKVFFDYCPSKQSYGIVWGGLQGTVEGPGEQGDWVATLTFTKNTTVGSMVETMVSWATGSKFALEAPWSVLNSIPLSGLSLTYTFNKTNSSRDKVAFNVDVGPIELGFARIDKISVAYNSQAAQKVAVTLVGSFPWNVGEGANGDTGTLGPWDASQPGTAPAAPGSGNKYLDLRLLALGQHVTIQGLTSATTVQKAVELMAKLKDPEPGKIPDVTFDPAVGWIIGADLGILRFGESTASPTADAVGYLVTSQLVFNDPYLYALRVALAGDAAKVLKGLDFQIMYRQVSDTVGVYQAEITLPDAMRHLSIGAYSITLPVFGLAVYTNGDFQVDVGFPWNTDFSRSFTIEGIIAPGIPVQGSAGFYFGKLSSATTDKVPKALNGTFNPVFVFGFGMRIGFGKSIEYGVLQAGFSVTAVGITEGVLGKFNPYLPAKATQDPAQIQDLYYFWLRGTFGIVGRLYGRVDFAVVKADVNVTLKLLLQLSYESYVSMAISVIVAVDVSVSIAIDLGLFSIKISFSFSMRLKETFTIDNAGTPPWVTAPATGHRLAGPADRRLGHRRAPRPELIAAAADPDRWRRLQPSPSGAAALTGWLAPGITVAHDERDKTQAPAKQLPCQVFLLLIDTVPENEGTVSEVVAATAAATDTPFELLAKMVLRWVVAAGQTDDLTPEQVDRLVVTQADLAHLLEEVLVSTDGAPLPITPDDVDSFLGRQFTFTAAVPDGSVAGKASATAFPMPPALRLTAPAYGSSYPGYDYVLAAYNELSDTTLTDLRAYFDQLAVQVGNERAATARLTQGRTLSMAEWVQSDYFLLLARQMVQAALESLRDFKYVIDGTSPAGIVADVNATGKLTGEDRISVPGLFAANPAHPLKAGRRLTIGAQLAVSGTDSFQSVSEGPLQSAVSPTDLATANAGADGLLRTGATITYKGTGYELPSGSTLIRVARHFGARLAELLSGATGLLTDRTLFTDGASLTAPLVTYQARTDSTFAGIAALPAYSSGGSPGFTGTALALQNAGRPVLRIGEKIGYGDRQYTVQANDTLADVAMHFAVSVTDLLENSGVLTQPRLLADVALVVLPPFGYETGANETLTSVARRFAIPVEVLGMAEANGVVSDLFATVDADSRPAPWIDVPHLAQYRVDEIIAETQRTLAIRQLSRMAGRYAMHGTRLPTTGITPKAKGIWVDVVDGKLTLPPEAGLYALTGQQIDVPLVDDAGGPFTVTFRRDGRPTWLTFAGGAETLSIKIKPGSSDATRLSDLVTTCTARPFDIGLTSLGADPMYERHLATYPLTTVAVWQAPTSVTLPYGPPPSGDRVQALRIWTLPDALVNLPDPRRGMTPRFAVRAATYDEATGGTTTSAVDSHGWATVVEFTVKRVPLVATSPATATTYEIVGAGGADVVLLERIVEEIGADDGAFAQLLLAYPPDATTAAPSGVQSDAPTGVRMGISQVNLSTETRPPTAAPLTGAEIAAPGGLLNTPSAFVRLLWEASITRTGGFYLYYYDGGSGRGLPERIFNDRGEAKVSLIVLYAKPLTEAAGDRVADYMTAVVTGDSIDTSRSVVFAEAAPMEAPVTATADLSLALLSERTYSDVADLAVDNRKLRLRTGVRLLISEGVFQAPPGGIPLATIVADFDLPDLASLEAANPRWTGGLPDPLPFPAAVDLPTMRVTAGSSPHTATLDDIAAFYGEELAALAAHNADVTGLFADEQQITVAGGPTVRDATVQAGVAALTATRDKPDEVPVKPGGDYAKLFLLNTFSLLGYRVAKNVYFSASNMGLPAGPTPPPTDSQPNHDKVRVAPISERWEYHQSLPYPGFAIAPAKAAAGLPPAEGDPYRGLGSILQVDFSWQDHYGNTLVTTLTTPPVSGDGPVNQPPIRVGYTDALIGLSQWPSVSSAWRVTGPSDAPRLDLRLSFDPSRYRGLISATATDANTVRATFTDALDPASATRVDNYRLDGGVSIASVALGGDGRTVTLTTDRPLSDLGYRLGVSNVLGVRSGDSAQPSYTGTATFRFPDEQGDHSSSLTDAAARDLSVYSALYYQLTDRNGMAATVTTSLLDKPVDVDSTQWMALLGWLFTDAGAVYAFLRSRAAGATDVPVPPSPHTISWPLAADDLNPSQVYELSVELTLRRTGGAVLGGLETMPGIRSATTKVAPMSSPLGSGGDALGLTAFAQDFETALSVPGSHLLKVAVGVDRAQASTSRDGATLWAVRVGTGTGEAISYTVTDVGDPDLFAPRPISNRLQTRTGVAIYDYTTGQGISTTPSRHLDFVDIDMDVWGRMLLATVDDTLAPEFTSAMRIVTARTGGTDHLQEILDQKKLLATAVSTWMIPLYAGQTPDPTAVQGEFYQYLLSRLSNAYSTRAGIQFTAAVDADIKDPLATTAPRLFGDVVDRMAEGEQRGEITLTSPKLPLTTAKDAALPFLLMAPETVSEHGAIVGSIDLDLAWNASMIEHQIAQPHGINGYLASSWLSFVVPGDTHPLTRPLGAFPVPLVLRSFPASPTMVSQNGTPDDPTSQDLSELTKWTYAFTWSLPFHYVQDKVYGQVEFNVAQTEAADSVADWFPALAEFVTIYPQVRADLDTILAGIDATTEDEQIIHDADVALTSFTDLLTRVTSSSGFALILDPPVRPFAGQADLTYSFQVEEGSIDLPDPDDPGETVTALLVTIIGAVPDGMGTPVVLVAPDRYEPRRYVPKEPADAVPSFSYYYVDPKTKQYLSQVDGQKVPGRTVVVPDLDILERQDAWSSVWITRNERILPDRPPSAEPFVYTTPDISFTDPLLPTIDSATLVDIAQIGPGGPDRTLDQHLSALFAALFDDLPEGVETVTIQVEAVYTYRLNPILEAIELPIFLQAPLSVVVAGDAPDHALKQMILNWTAALFSWFTDAPPNSADGTLRFDLTILSNLTRHPMPLLRLRNLTLAVTNVVPPLPTR
ncbi:LysM peptidoglycan-binding domain-containing protein [Nonomuraea sp. NPDC050536]|uniref:LysM peptidoglycan-binding domain-containing protein n=1 Tax=Nonomuraea sp. NPDC050536 TaxID=3364366 RepID=UPI0037C7E411